MLGPHMEHGRPQGPGRTLQAHKGKIVTIFIFKGPPLSPCLVLHTTLTTWRHDHKDLMFRVETQGLTPRLCFISVGVWIVQFPTCDISTRAAQCCLLLLSKIMHKFKIVFTRRQQFELQLKTVREDTETSSPFPHKSELVTGTGSPERGATDQTDWNRPKTDSAHILIER